MTAPALAVLALRFRCPIIPGRIRRLGRAWLRLEVEPPLALLGSGDRQADVAALMRTVNRTLERWITDEAAAWLWLHRRWPKETALASG
jgi:KDO2-lipid IV(A) lauroyltransferase